MCRPRFFYIVVIFFVLLSFKLQAQTDIFIGYGTSTNSSSGVPAPYGSYYRTFREHYLIRASEITSAGGARGYINSVGWNVASLNGTNTNRNMIINMKTTTQNSLSSTFETGTYTTVWTGPYSYFCTLGWNTHSFTSPFYWDGTSNLIVEVIAGYRNLNNVNASCYYTTTQFASSLRYQTNTPNLPMGTTGVISNNRSNIRFNMQFQTNDLTAVSISGSNTPRVGESSGYTVTIFNSGASAQTDYSVKLIMGANTEVASVQGSTIASSQTLQYNIPWVPIAPGSTFLRGKVVLGNDGEPANDLTPNINVTVIGSSDLAALSASCTTYPRVGISSEIVVSVKNIGSASQSDYQVKLYSDDDTEVGSVEGDLIDSGETIQYPITWVPDASGSVTLYGKVELLGDSDPTNDFTAFLNVIVAPLDDLAAQSISGNPMPRIGDETLYTITVSNTGATSQSDYQIRLFRDGSIEIGTLQGNPIAPGDTLFYSIPWIPSTLGATTLTGVVYLDGDSVLVNDLTPQFNVNVLSYKFTEIILDLPHEGVQWGDYDNDGDLDLLSGNDIYRNDGYNEFVNINAGLPSGGEWADYDNDGDLDILSGSIILRNNGSDNFTSVNTNLPGGGNWGDFDNDGDLDVLVGDQLFRNDGNETFTNMNAGLVNPGGASAGWGDYDNDGDLDVMVGYYIYRNDGGATFTNINAGLFLADWGGAADWGDYDQDGDLDLVMMGDPHSSIVITPISKVYRNDGNSVFTDIGAGLHGLYRGTAKWADVDNDGDLDIILSGIEEYSYGLNGFTLIYLNQGFGVFSEGYTVLPSIGGGNLTVGDYDNDGDIDVLLTERTGWSTFQNRLIRNEAMIPNTVPSAPENLLAMISGSEYVLNWDTSVDAQTPSAGLSYTVRIGTTPGGCNIMSPWSNSDGYRLKPGIGNVRRTEGWSVDLSNVDIGADCFLSVQAIDTGFAGSPFSTEIVLPSMRVISPNGGENWRRTSVQTVRWSTRLDRTVNILLSTNNGSTWTTLNSSPIGGSLGRFSLTLPPITSTQCLVKIVDTENSDVVDVSDNVFTISTSPSTSITYTESTTTRIQTGRDFNIGWTAVGVNYVRLDYSLNGGVDWVAIADSINAIDQVYLWHVPDLPSTQCFVRISDMTNPAIYDSNNEPITLVRLRLLSPLEDSVIQTGSNNIIRWSSAFSSSLNIEYSPDGGSSWSFIASSINASSGFINWTTPTTASANNLIRITDSTDSSIWDSLNSPFQLASLSVTYPNNIGQKLLLGSVVSISWNQQFLSGNVTIQVTTNGTSWETIAQGIDASIGHYNWIVNKNPSSTCKIKVVSEIAGIISDTSDSVFSICSLILLTHNNGGVYQTDKQSVISWNSQFISSVRLEYSLDNGSSWNIITGSTAAAGGSFTWTTPSLTSLMSLIRISDTTDNSICAVSGTSFCLVKLEVTYPIANNVKLQPGRTVNITWDQEHIQGTVKIDFSSNNGTTWLTVASRIDSSLEIYPWTIPDSPSVNCRIKISSEREVQIYDVSDNSFTISCLDVIVPNGNVTWSSGTNRTISWRTINVDSIKLEFSLDYGDNWMLISESIPASSLSFNWTVPDIGFSELLIRATDVSSSLVYDVTDSVVSVVPGLTILSPNGGELLSFGSLCDIRWVNSDDVSFITIDYSIDNGTSWIPLESSPYPTSWGVYGWVVPNTSSDNCLIRVKNNDNNAVLDVCDAFFTISDTEFSPTVSFSATSLSGSAPFTVQFTDYSVAGTGYITSWYWEFGDGLSSSDQDPVHTYTDPGLYTVSLTVTNSLNASTTLIRTGYISVIGVLPPSNPDNVCIAINGNDVFITWDPVIADVEGNPIIVTEYNIYAFDNPVVNIDPGHIIGTANTNSFTYLGAALNNKKFFAVTANNSQISESTRPQFRKRNE